MLLVVVVVIIMGFNLVIMFSVYERTYRPDFKNKYDANGCRQQRLKEEKELKRGKLDSRHNHVLTIVADSLDLERPEVDDAILEGNQVRVARACKGVDLNVGLN